MKFNIAKNWIDKKFYTRDFQTAVNRFIFYGQRIIVQIIPSSCILKNIYRLNWTFNFVNNEYKFTDSNEHKIRS